MLIRIPHRVVYEASGPVAVSDIVGSLQGVERLLQECGPILEACFEGVTVERIDVSVEEISQHSPLKEMFWAAVIVVAQTQLEKDVPAVLEDLLGVNLPPQYDSILAFIFVILVFYGARELTPVLKADFITRMRQSVKLARKFKEAGGLQRVVDHEVKNWIDAHLNALLYVGIKKKMKVPFCIPHITSFCSHKDDIEYERENGLLSQWRGYGTRGAYALVFNTARLSELIRKEYGKYTYHQGSMFDVRYDRQPVEIKDNYSHLVKSIATSYTNHIFGEGDVNVDADTLLKLATRLKHRGFFEEREVRLVLCPMYQEYVEEYGDNPDLVKDPNIKKRYDKPRPHISLFEDLGEELPINRIIVGPSATQKKDVEMTRALVGSRIKVVASETPYRLI